MTVLAPIFLKDLDDGTKLTVRYVARTLTAVKRRGFWWVSETRMAEPTLGLYSRLGETLNKENATLNELTDTDFKVVSVDPPEDR